VKVTLSLVDWIVFVVGPVVELFQERIVPGGRLLNVTDGKPGLTPVGLTSWIPLLIFKPMLPGLSSTTTDVPLYVKNGRNNDGILDGCEDGVELGTLEGFALGAALSGLTSIVILEEQSWQIGTKKQRDKKRNDKIST